MKKKNAKTRAIKTVKVTVQGKNGSKIIACPPKVKVEVANAVKETYTFSSIFPNEDIMRRAFKILYGTE